MTSRHAFSRNQILCLLINTPDFPSELFKSDEDFCMSAVFHTLKFSYIAVPISSSSPSSLLQSPYSHLPTLLSYLSSLISLLPAPSSLLRPPSFLLSFPTISSLPPPISLSRHHKTPRPTRERKYTKRNIHATST